MNPIITVTMNPAIDQVIEIERLVVGSMNRAVSSVPMTGGKGINVARALKGFNMDVVALGFSAGSGWAMMKQTLIEEGITPLLIDVAGEVRVNLKIHAHDSGKTTEINQPGFSITEKDFELLSEALEKILPEAAALVLTGSLPAGTPKDAYKRLGSLAKSCGVPVFLDADGENLKYGISASPYAVKPNRDELEQYAGRTLKTPQDWIYAMRALQEKSGAKVAATMGVQGVMMLDGECAWHAEALKIVPACATGAGDTALAAMIWAWHKEHEPSLTARLMSAAGGVTASKPGLAFCSLEEMLGNSEMLKVSRFD